MRVLLLRPPKQFVRKPAMPPKSNHWTYPLRFAYLAAELQHLDGTIGFLDCPYKNYDVHTAAGAVFAFHADVIYCELDAQHVQTQVAFLETIKRFSSVRLVIGGPYASFCHEALCQALPAVDAVIRDEPDETLFDILTCWNSGLDVTYLPGVTTPGTKKCLSGPARPLIDQLDALPFPDRSMVPLAAYQKGCRHKKPFTLLAGSRGCPRSCAFCRMGAKQQAVRHRSPGNIAYEVETLIHQHKVREIRFVDAIFNRNATWASEVMEALMPLGITWSCNGTTCGLDQAQLRLLRRSGCRDIFVGAVCPSQAKAEALGVLDGPDTVKQALGYARQEDIRLHLRILTGDEPLPGYEEALWFANSLSHCEVGIRWIHPQYGSALNVMPPKTLTPPPVNHDMQCHITQSKRSMEYWRRRLAKAFRPPPRQACLDHGPEQVR